MNIAALILTDSNVPGTHNLKVVKLSETELIAGLCSGNPKTLDILYKMYSATLYGIILRIVKKEECAEDVLQETFLKIWQSFKLYDASKGRLYTWMSNIARNLSIDQVKAKSFRNNAKNEDITEITQTVDHQFNISNDPDIIGIRDFSKRLKPEHSTILELVYFGGYTHVEAAEELGIPVGTLKTRLRMGVTELRKLFN